MRWPWSRRPPASVIPQYQPPIEVKAPAPKPPGLIVEEIDTKDMTSTGIFRAWKRMTGKD